VLRDVGDTELMTIRDAAVNAIRARARAQIRSAQIVRLPAPRPPESALENARGTSSALCRSERRAYGFGVPDGSESGCGG
jgi:hypothetical protein